MNVCLVIVAKDSHANVERAIQTASCIATQCLLVVNPSDPLMTFKSDVLTRVGTSTTGAAVINNSSAPMRIRIIEEKWEGFIRTRNAAIAHAEELGAHWIFMIDASDVIIPNAKLDSLASVLASDHTSFRVPVLRETADDRILSREHGHLFKARSGAHFGRASSDYHATFNVQRDRGGQFDGVTIKKEERQRDPHHDVNALEIARNTDPHAAYLYAHALKDIGRFMDAYVAFRARCTMASPDREETFWAMLWAGKVSPYALIPTAEQDRCFDEAIHMAPDRAEPFAEYAVVMKKRENADETARLMRLAQTRAVPTNATSIDLESYSDRALKDAGIDL